MGGGGGGGGVRGGFFLCVLGEGFSFFLFISVRALALNSVFSQIFWKILLSSHLGTDRWR